MTQLGLQAKVLAQAMGYWADEEVRSGIELAGQRGNDKRLTFYINFFKRLKLSMPDGDSNPHLLLPDPDAGEVDQGEIRLGDLTTGGEVRLPLDEVPLNILIVAPPKAEKTMFVTSFPDLGAVHF
jgi:hypothetical protein